MRRFRKHLKLVRHRAVVDRREGAEIVLGSPEEGIVRGSREAAAIDLIREGRRSSRCVRIRVAAAIVLSLGDRIQEILGATDQIRRVQIRGRRCVRRTVRDRAGRLRGDVRRLRVLRMDGGRMTGRGCTGTMCEI
jgi:hypothetical protein